MEETLEHRRERLRHSIGIIRERHNGAIRIKRGDTAILSLIVQFKKDFGLSSNRCADLLGIAPHQMGYLLTRAREKTKTPTVKRPKLKEVQITESIQSSAVELVLPSGVRAIFPTVQQSAEFLRTL